LAALGKIFKYILSLFSKDVLFNPELYKSAFNFIKETSIVAYDVAEKIPVGVWAAVFVVVLIKIAKSSNVKSANA